jgi:CRP-like cAMP-binding protein
LTQAIQNQNDLLRALEDHGLHTQNLNFSPGSILYEHGAPPEGLIFITSGKVRTFLPVRDESIEIEKIGPGEFLGLPAVIADKNSEISAVAESKVKAVFISRNEIAEALRKNPHLYLVINPFLSDALSSAYTVAYKVVVGAECPVLTYRRE